MRRSCVLPALLFTLARLASSSAAASLSPSPSPSPSPAPSPAQSSCFDGRCLPDWFPTLLGAFLLVGGLVETFAGYRFFKHTLVLLGAVALGGPVWVLTWDHIGALIQGVTADGALGAGGAAGAVAGLIGALLCWRFFRVGVFVIGALLGVLIADVLNLAVFVHLPIPASQLQAPFIASAVVLGGAFGAVALRWLRPSMIAATSALGGYAAIRGISFFAGSFPNELDLESEVLNGETLPWQTYAYLSAAGVLALLGVFVQTRFTAPRVKDGEKDENEQALEDADLDLFSERGGRARGGAALLHCTVRGSSQHPHHTYPHLPPFSDKEGEEEEAKGWKEKEG
jgi:MFS family permease